MGSFYLRSGHNFSADWISRTNIDTILEWGDSVGFRGIRFKAIWNDFISDWGKNQCDGWEPFPVMLDRKKPCFPGKCVEWSSAGGGLTRDAMDMGVPAEYLYPRHTYAIEWSGRNHGPKRYLEGEIPLLGGADQTEREISQYGWVIGTYQPKVSAIMAPLGLEMGGNRLGHVYIADGSQHGDVLA